MDPNNKTLCGTNLLDDLPAQSDAFASDGDSGPHQRVADAIGDMIESAEVGGKAIGLEGGWGSGKSTVVRFLSDRFSKNDDYTVVLFDAWAHEGDPLRRTFIESVVNELSEYGWADKDIWKKKLEELANRRKKTQTLISPNATLFGTLAAVSLLLIPLGIALTNAGLRQSVTLDINRSVNWLFTIGLLLVLCPFWILLTRTLYVLFTERRRPKLSDYAFITNEAVSETHTETIETPEPTSLEFDDYFGTLMAEALSKEKSRRLLLVLDNLDRVDAETALSIWGTLQTFLHDRDHDHEVWYKQLWVVVPYDPIRIRKLWNQPEEQELAEKDEQSNKGVSEARRTTESFLDKSFQVRFHVAPPVLSDWKSFLYELVEEALPSHIEDCHMIYRVFDHCRARGGDPPTPRELKLYVNQIGAIHRQWQHEFPIAHVAFFALTRKEHSRIIDELRRDGFPSDEDCRLLSDDLISSLAGLAFNVRAAKGLELLLADSISDAFKSPEPADLRKIAERNGAGFWAVFETIATTRWHEEDAQGITKIATQLRASKLLEQYDGPETSVILNALRDAGINLKTWMPVSGGLGNGIGDLLTLQSDQEFSTVVLKKFCSQIAKVDSSKEGAPNAASVAGTLFLFFDVAKSLGHADSMPQTITMPFNGEQWITACTEIIKHDKHKSYWRRLKPRGKFEDVTDSLVSKVSSGEFSEPDVAALKVTQLSAIKCEWQGVCTAIQNRLDAAQTVTADECVQLLRGLFQLEALGVEESLSAQKALSEPGHLLHHFHLAKSQNEFLAQAAIIFSFAGQNPDLTTPTASGNSEAGHQMLTKAVSSPEKEVIAALYDLTDQYDLLPDVLWVIQNSDTPHAMFVEVLKLVADSESPEVVFTTEVTKEHWPSLRQQLNEKGDKSRFQKLVGQLAQANGLCDFLEQSENGFEADSSLLYLDILRGAKGSVPNFVKWCREGLQRMSKEDWAADLTGNNANCAVCIELSKQEHPPSLTNNFTDALQDHAQSVIQGNDIPSAWIANTWSTVVDCVDESSGTRKVLRERLIDMVVSADGNVSDEFFDMYGGEIAESSILATHDRVLSHFFTPLVSEKHQRGLDWLAEFAQENPNFIEKVEAEHTAQDFTNRLQGLVDNPIEDKAQVTIESLATHFGIESTPQPVEPDESETVEEDQAADAEGTTE